MNNILNRFGVMLFALFMATTVVATAQVNTIAFNQFQSTYNEIVGTPVALTSGADDAIYAVPIGFTFRFNNVNHTTAYACTNGYIALGGTASTQPYMYPNPMNYTATVDGVLCPWGGDLDGKTTGTLSYQVTGVAPYRVLTIQWKNWQYWSSSYAGTNLNFQVKLYETSGQVEYIYGNCTRTATMPAIYVGMRGPVTTDFQTRTITSGDWVNSLKGTTNTSTMTFNATTKPTSGLIYRWGCYVDNSKIAFDIVNSTGGHLSVLNTPNTTNFNIKVGFPNSAFSIGVLLDFYLIGGGSAPVYSYSTSIPKGISDLDVTFGVNIPQLPSGYYRIVATITTMNSCMLYENVSIETSVLALQSHETACIVWPGDVNNDDIVNYGDRSSLNRYIYDANLRPTWLNGPARYRVDAGSNQMVYLTWEAQPSVPWFTPEGCYMDTDGNGIVNNFDLLAVKINFLKAHQTGLPKAITSAVDASVTPNPFSDKATISYTLSEPSKVVIYIVNMTGNYSTIINDVRNVGYNTELINRNNLSTGVYFIHVITNGLETNVVNTQTFKTTIW